MTLLRFADFLVVVKSCCSKSKSRALFFWSTSWGNGVTTHILNALEVLIKTHYNIYLTLVLLNCFICIFRHLKLELLTQFPASNDEKYDFLWKMNMCENYHFDQLSIHRKLFCGFQCHFIFTETYSKAGYIRLQQHNGYKNILCRLTYMYICAYAVDCGVMCMFIHANQCLLYVDVCLRGSHSVYSC